MEMDIWTYVCCPLVLDVATEFEEAGVLLQVPTIASLHPSGIILCFKFPTNKNLFKMNKTDTVLSRFGNLYRKYNQFFYLKNATQGQGFCTFYNLQSKFDQKKSYQRR